jgi:hypothetical protein
MNTSTLSSVVVAAATPAASAPSRGLGALLIAEALLSFAPLAVLGGAIGWPASLGKPAAEQLPAIAGAPNAVALGYGLYLLYSILIAPLTIGLAARAFGGLHSPLAATVAAFGALSALARSIGILRWLTVMPALAHTHAGADADADADAAARLQIELLFNAITSYGGGIGELLGVSLFMALALGLLCVGAGWRGGMPAWLAVPGALCAALLLGLMLPALRLPVQVPVAAAVTVLTLWMLAAGLWCWRGR